MEKLKSNDNLNSAFRHYLGWKKPGTLPDHGGYADYPERIEQIMNCNGKDSNSLQDLMELYLRLESKDSREINAIMEAWRDRYAIYNKYKNFSSCSFSQFLRYEQLMFRFVDCDSRAEVGK